MLTVGCLPSPQRTLFFSRVFAEPCEYSPGYLRCGVPKILSTMGGFATVRSLSCGVLPQCGQNHLSRIQLAILTSRSYTTCYGAGSSHSVVMPAWRPTALCWDPLPVLQRGNWGIDQRKIIHLPAALDCCVRNTCALSYLDHSVCSLRLVWHSGGTSIHALCLAASASFAVKGFEARTSYLYVKCW